MSLELQRKSVSLHQQLPEVSAAVQFVRGEVESFAEQLEGARNYLEELIAANDVYVRAVRFVLQFITDRVS